MRLLRALLEPFGALLDAADDLQLLLLIELRVQGSGDASQPLTGQRRSRRAGRTRRLGMMGLVQSHGIVRGHVRTLVLVFFSVVVASWTLSGANQYDMVRGRQRSTPGSCVRRRAVGLKV